MYVNLQSEKQRKKKFMRLVKPTTGVQKHSIGKVFYDVVDSFACQRRFRRSKNNKQTNKCTKECLKVHPYHSVKKGLEHKHALLSLKNQVISFEILTCA